MGNITAARLGESGANDADELGMSEDVRGTRATEV